MPAGIVEYLTRYSEPLDLNIDLLALDQEWLRQPRMYMTAAAEAADAAAEVDRAKSALAIIKAEVELSARRDPESHGLVKATDNSVAAVVVTNVGAMDAEDRLNKARHAAAIAHAAVEALEHRKRALEGIVTLQGREQYASPRAPKTELGEEMTAAETRSIRQRAIKNRDS